MKVAMQGLVAETWVGLPEQARLLLPPKITSRVIGGEWPQSDLEQTSPGSSTAV